MSGALRRIAPALRRVGINVVFPPRDPGRKRTRILRIEHTRPYESGNFASEPSAPSGAEQKDKQTQGRSPDDSGRKADAAEPEPKDFASAENRKESKAYSPGSRLEDDADAKVRGFSAVAEDAFDPGEKRAEDNENSPANLASSAATPSDEFGAVEVPEPTEEAENRPNPPASTPDSGAFMKGEAENRQPAEDGQEIEDEV